MAEGNKSQICKRIVKQTPLGNILEEKYLQIQGENLAEVSKEFDKKWKEQ